MAITTFRYVQRLLQISESHPLVLPFNFRLLNAMHVSYISVFPDLRALSLHKVLDFLPSTRMVEQLSQSNSLHRALFLLPWQWSSESCSWLPSTLFSPSSKHAVGWVRQISQHGLWMARWLHSGCTFSHLVKAVNQMIKEADLDKFP